MFEDVNYGGGAGRSFGASLGVVRDGARVELYDSTGAFVASQLTDVTGVYNFPVTGPGTYTVRVVNSTVTSSRTLPVVVGLLPVQTFRTDASAGSGAPAPVPNRVGGEIPSLVDAGPNTTGLTLAQLTTATTTAQSISTVTFGVAANINSVNFGFNFNTIVNVNDSGQGSLRQYILNSNALDNTGLTIVGQPAGRDVSIFMISDGQVHAGLRAGLANLLTAGVAVIVVNPAADLPAITAANTSVDGTTQTANVGNTNAVVLGTGGTVGVDGLALGTVAGPEVEIRGDSGTNNDGLLIQGALAANAIVRGLAIHGFGNANGEAGVNVNGGSTALIERNVLGSSATSFADPGSSAQRNQAGVYGASSSNSTVQNNLIGFGRTTGIYLAAGATGWTLAGNEIRDSGRWDNADGDGITINTGTTNTATGNLVTGASSQGVVVTAAGTSGNVFTNNTVTGNGVGTTSGLVQTPGIALRSGAASTVLDRNVIRANYGAGVQVNNGSTGTRMTRNSFALNGTITARNGAVATGQIGIDLNSATDSIDLGTSPFPTLNDADDADTGGNGLLNFPVLWWATLSGGILRVGGYARPGSVIELFIASPPPDPTGFGEGTTYSITLTEGGTGAGGNDPYPDTDAGTGTYGPAAVNGDRTGHGHDEPVCVRFPGARGDRRRNAADRDRDSRRRDVGVRRQRDRGPRYGGGADVLRGGALGRSGGAVVANGLRAREPRLSTCTGRARRTVPGRGSRHRSSRVSARLRWERRTRTWTRVSSRVSATTTSWRTSTRDRSPPFTDRSGPCRLRRPRTAMAAGAETARNAETTPSATALRKAPGKAVPPGSWRLTVIPPPRSVAPPTATLNPFLSRSSLAPPGPWISSCARAASGPSSRGTPA